MSRRVFLYDDQDLAARHNLNLTPGPVEKLGIAGLPHRTSDFERASVFAGSVVPMPGGGYRLYYSAAQWGGGHKFRVALAESEDGMNWSQTNLGQVQFEGEDTNWVWPEGMPEGHDITQPQVCLLPNGDWRMWYWWHGHDIGHLRYVVCESTDGINWKVIDLEQPHIMHPADLELGQNAWVAGLTAAREDDRFADERTMLLVEAKRLRSNDATYVYYNEDTSRFEMYSVWLVPTDETSGRYTPHDNAPQVIRTIQRRESPDSIEWSDPELIIAPDEHDPMHQEFYYLAMQREDNWAIGFLGHYRCWEQTMDIELCFSRDTHHWQRPLRGGWIPRGGLHEPDYMSAYATNRMIDEGDTWLMLYQGGNTKHNSELPEGVETKVNVPMAARAPKGRLAGLKTTERMIGSVTLKPFNQSAEQTTVDADIRGRLQAELRDPFGRPIAGYELNNCPLITGDSRCHVLRWENGKTSADYRYDTVGLRLEIEDGTLYSIDT